MFCSEPIQKVFYLCYSEMQINDAYCFFHFSPTVEFHATDGYWLILQTDHHYIKIGTDGIRCLNSLEDCLSTKYDIEDTDCLTEVPRIAFIETAVFLGERIHRLSKDGNIISIRFDHFTMRLYAHMPKNFPYLQNSRYISIPPLQHRLTRKCACGGTAEIMLDCVDDFIVRCKQCHCATYAGYDCMSVIEDWNDGETPIKLDTDAERFETVMYEPIKRIAMSENHICYDDNLYDCESMMLELADNIFEISAQETDEENYDFAIREWKGYNPERWPYRICAEPETPIVFLRKEFGENRHPTLWYEIGNKELIVTADNAGSITFGWVHGEGKVHDNKSLFNEFFEREQKENSDGK